jgi:hypothetical protein
MIASEHPSLSLTIVVGSAVLVVAFVLRILPHLLAPLGIGVDHWYWKAYIEKYRKERKFPPDLPQYLLESDQWYPPVFPLMLAFLPRALFDKFSHVLAILIDLFRIVCLMAIVYSLTGGNAIAVGASGGVYALTPLLVSYNVQLNPRGMGAIMLDLLFFAAILIFFFRGPLWLWLVLIPSCGLLLLTHKMTTQLFWFLCLVGSVFLDWRLILLIPLSAIVAMTISKGFYRKVLAHHWDILSFWYRNWPWLGANPVKESPIYGDPGFETPRKAHRKGMQGIIKHLYSQLAYNPFAWLLIAIFVLDPATAIPPGSFPLFVLGGLGLTLVFALSTALLPPLRFLGAGHLYLYNATFPSALLWGLLVNRNYAHVAALLLAGAVASAFAIARFYLHVKESESIKIDRDFEAALGFLSSRPKATVMCVPPQWYDVVAYKTALPVLYGGHGYGFKMLEETYPRLLISISELIARFNLRYILFECGAVTEKFIADIPAHIAQEFGKYRVISIDVAK